MLLDVYYILVFAGFLFLPLILTLFGRDDIFLSDNCITSFTFAWVFYSLTLIWILQITYIIMSIRK